MISDENIETLNQIPVFGGLQAETIVLILEHSNLTKKQSGEYFFHENDHADSMYVLRSEKIEVTRCRNNKTYHMTQMIRSDCFGEMAMIDHRTRSANIRAITLCEAIEISSSAMTALWHNDIKAFAMLQMNIAREVSRRLREANDQFLADRVMKS